MCIVRRAVLVSLVVPCLNEEKAIPVFYNEVCAIERDLGDLEFVFIDDGSTDGTLEAIKGLQKKDNRVRYVSFSRNFGKEAAMLAGLEHAYGDYVAIMDVDLQDPPSLLPEMYQILEESGSAYDCVATRRKDRKGEPKLRSFFSRSFYKLMGHMSDTPIVDGARDYRLMSRKMVDAVVSDKEYCRFSKGLFSWVGFNTKWLEYENVERSIGNTKWSFSKLFKYSVEGLLAYSTVPLSIISVLGVIAFLASLIGFLFVFVRALLFGDPVAGWPSIVCLIMLFGALNMLCIGIVGLYLSKIYMETKRRPIYIVRETDSSEERAEPRRDKQPSGTDAYESAK